MPVPSPLAQVCPGPSQRTPGWPCPIGEPQTEPRGTSSPDYGGCFHVRTDARFVTSGLDTVPPREQSRCAMAFAQRCRLRKAFGLAITAKPGSWKRSSQQRLCPDVPVALAVVDKTISRQNRRRTRREDASMVLCLIGKLLRPVQVADSVRCRRCPPRRTTCQCYDSKRRLN